MNDIMRDESIKVGELFNQSQTSQGEFTQDGGIILTEGETKKLPNELESKLQGKFQELNVAIKTKEDSTYAAQVKQISEAQQLAAQSIQPEELDKSPAISAVKAAFSGKDITIDGKAVSRSNEQDTPMAVTDTLDNQPHNTPQYQQQEERSDVTSLDGIVQINVPQGTTNDVIAQLSKEDRDKVQVAKSIVVTEIKEVKIPTATKKITDLNQYKQLTTSGLTEPTVMVPLPNSRFLVYVKGCGSLALATLMGDTSNHLDYIKRIEFCFKQITHTSIGQLSFDDFTKRVSPEDIDVIIHGILKASNPDEDELELTCGNPKCQKSFNYKYQVAGLVDIEESHEDLLKVVGEITDAARTVTDARAYHETAAIRNAKVIELPNGNIIELVSPTVYTLIEKLPVRKQLEQEYNVFTAMMCMLIGKLYIKGTDAEGNTQFYEVDDIQVMADAIYGFSDEDLAIIKEVSQTMSDLGRTAFAVKNVKCPHCEYLQDSVPVDMDTMVFMKLRMSQII